jgi:predicted site-specific integrase-resolvase
MSDERLTLGRAAEYVGVHPKHLQRLDREGKLPASGRTSTGRRWYLRADLDLYFGVRPAMPEKPVPAVYCRVSSSAQKPDLANQKRLLGEFCAARGLAGVEWVEEIGGGLNMERPKFLALMDRIERRELSHLVLAHTDRLTRFGFPWFERFAQAHGCKVLVLNNEALSPEKEMIEDLLTIVHCFSARLYGLRRYRKSLKAALEQEATK